MAFLAALGEGAAAGAVEGTAATAATTEGATAGTAANMISPDQLAGGEQQQQGNSSDPVNKLLGMANGLANEVTGTNGALMVPGPPPT